jgi:hypothetical protein
MHEVLCSPATLPARHEAGVSPADGTLVDLADVDMRIDMRHTDETDDLDTLRVRENTCT